jgi:tetratricopeptide (TPR) repeat protein
VFLAAFLTLVSAVSGCVSARMSETQIALDFSAGRMTAAVQRLEKGLKAQEPNGRDLLLYLMDLGLVLHTAGRYEDSIRYFRRADDIADIKDYTSLSLEASTLLTSDNFKDYKGEDFEKVLINTYLAMNYALVGRNEDALVEARRVNRKLLLMVQEGGRKYKQNAFARYLSGILYEKEGNWNDAYVDYKETWKLMPTFPGLGRDLWRLARLNRNAEDAEKWEREFDLGEQERMDAMRAGPGSAEGEIVVLYQNGISPEKVQSEQAYNVPRFRPRWNPVREARVWVDGKMAGVPSVLHDIEETAIQNLDDNMAGIVAKKVVAGTIAKETAAYGIEKATDSPLLGLAAKVFFYASDQADLRSWNLLPRDLQVLRIPVPPGLHQVRLEPEGRPGKGMEKTIQVGAGKKVFVAYRYMP